MDLADQQYWEAQLDALQELALQIGEMITAVALESNTLAQALATEQCQVVDAENAITSALAQGTPPPADTPTAASLTREFNSHMAGNCRIVAEGTGCKRDDGSTGVWLTMTCTDEKGNPKTKSWCARNVQPPY